MTNHKIICSEHKDCPVKDCPHKEPHENSFCVVHIGKVKVYCDTQERICGERYPKERILVICQPIEPKKCRASAVAGHQEPIPV